MQRLMKYHLIQYLFLLLLLLNLFIIPSSTSQDQLQPSIAHNCGSIKLPQPFTNQNLLNNMLICRTNKLYFRTTVGLFQVSSIDYTHKLLTVSSHSRNPPCSSATDHFLSPPHHLSDGFPPLPSNRPNSLILFNCSNRTSQSQVKFSPCNNKTEVASRCYGGGGDESRESATCLVVEDVRKLDKGFHPRDLNCTHYSRVYKAIERYETGIRVSFDFVPDHVPNPCDECQKIDGNCGPGLRCLCHPIKCKDKVISAGAVLETFGSRFVYVLPLLIAVHGILTAIRMQEF